MLFYFSRTLCGRIGKASTYKQFVQLYYSAWLFGGCVGYHLCIWNGMMTGAVQYAFNLSVRDQAANFIDWYCNLFRALGCLILLKLLRPILRRFCRCLRGMKVLHD